MAQLLQDRLITQFNDIYNNLTTITSLEYICKEISKSYKANVLLVSNLGIILSKINYNSIDINSNAIKNDIFQNYDSKVNDKLPEDILDKIKQYTKDNTPSENLLISDLLDENSTVRKTSIAIIPLYSNNLKLSIAYLVAYFEYRKWKEIDLLVFDIISKCLLVIMEHTIEQYDNQRKEIRDYLVKISTKGGDGWGSNSRGSAFAIRDIKCIAQLLSDYKEYGYMDYIRTIKRHNIQSHSDSQKAWSKFIKQFPQHIKIGVCTTDIKYIDKLIFEEVKKRMIEMKFSEDELKKYVRW